MRRIGRRDTRPEMQLRRLLHAHGFRYRLGHAALPMKPDLVFPSARVAVFVHGCFWHGHACHLFQWPRSNTAFWQTKIVRNVARDLRAESELLELGWRSLTVWECTFRGRRRLDEEVLVSLLRGFLDHGGETVSHIPHGQRSIRADQKMPFYP